MTESLEAQICELIKADSNNLQQPQSNDRVQDLPHALHKHRPAHLERIVDVVQVRVEHDHGRREYGDRLLAVKPPLVLLLISVDLLLISVSASVVLLVLLSVVFNSTLSPVACVVALCKPRHDALHLQASSLVPIAMTTVSSTYKSESLVPIAGLVLLVPIAMTASSSRLPAGSLRQRQTTVQRTSVRRAPAIPQSRTCHKPNKLSTVDKPMKSHMYNNEGRST